METWGKNYINKDHKFKHTVKKSRNVFFLKYNEFLDFPKKFKEENQLGSVLHGSIEIFWYVWNRVTKCKVSLVRHGRALKNWKLVEDILLETERKEQRKIEKVMKKLWISMVTGLIHGGKITEDFIETFFYSNSKIGAFFTTIENKILCLPFFC